MFRPSSESWSREFSARLALDRTWLAAPVVFWLVALSLLAVYLAPFVVLGRDVPILIHDNLDSNFVWYTILANSGQIAASSETIIPNLLGGLPRGAFGSEFDVQLWLYAAFDPLVAYALNQALMRAIALVGAFLLLREFVIPGDGLASRSVQLGCALCFALLPFWPSGGLAIAGQPLALAAFLMIRRGTGRPFDWIVLALLPLYGKLVFASLFFIAALGGFAAFDALRKREWNGPFWGALVLHGVVLLAVDYRLFGAMLVDSGVVSHRNEFDPLLLPFTGALRDAARLLTQGHYHAASLQGPVMLLALGGAAIAMLRARELSSRLLACLAGVCAICVFYGLWRWQGFESVRGGLSLGIGFNMARFYTLLPLLWISIFAIALVAISRVRFGGPALAGTLIAAQIAQCFLASDVLVAANTHGIGYAAFFATDQFAAIETEIGLPKSDYRVASVGLHPSVAQYNGFRTVDGYHPSYPLAHKHAMRRLIRHELDQSPALARYFDGWGNRAYVFSSEIGRNYLDAGEALGRLERFRLDPEAFESLGLRYLISAVEISDPKSSGLHFRRSFPDPVSAWTLHLYETVPPDTWAAQ